MYSYRNCCLFIFLLFAVGCWSQTLVSVKDKQRWKTSDLSPYVGKTVRMADDWYVCSNQSGYYVSPRRIFSPTNQCLPMSAEYNTLLSLNSQGTVSISGISGYHRTGERLRNMVVYVNSTGSLSLQSCEWVGNSRSDMQKGLDMSQIDSRGTHDILVCGANLRYYLVENLGTGYGPSSYEAHQAQRKKVSQALALINADIYALVEIELGQSALKEIAADLSQKTGRSFSYINDGTLPSSSYTKAGYVYCTQKIEPYGDIRTNNYGVNYRKQMQCFQDKSSGERFIVSINHFKAKSGTGTGDNADKGDGQGTFNGDRKKEAESVVNEYRNFRTYIGEDDILVLGDLNAYAKEDPIRILTDNGMTDLHRYFHADSSYSYVYNSQTGYLDHALCNESMLKQVTGMMAYHVNSDEKNSYSYNMSNNDGTMFRYSDHDPIIVGLRMGQQSVTNIDLVSDESILFEDNYLSHQCSRRTAEDI